MKSTFKKRCAIALTAAAVATVTAITAHAGQPLNVCASYKGDVRTIAIDVSNRCTSSSAKYLGHNLKFTVVPGTAILEMTGGLNYRSYKIGSADCMNRQTIHFKIPNAKPRRYILIDNGKRRGIVDFTKSHDRRCVQPRQSPVRYRSIANDSNAPARKLVRRKLPNLKGTSIQAILKPLMDQLTMSEEGRDTLSLSIETVDRIGRSGKRGAVATITAHGLGDDSVSSLRYVVDFIEQPDGWLAYGMATQQMCGRGSDAGLWTAKSCP